MVKARDSISGVVYKIYRKQNVIIFAIDGNHAV